jgi:hypothetical protein
MRTARDVLVAVLVLGIALYILLWAGSTPRENAGTGDYVSPPVLVQPVAPAPAPAPAAVRPAPAPAAAPVDEDEQDEQDEPSPASVVIVDEEEEGE